MKYLFVITFVVTYYVFGLELGYVSHSSLCTHLTYMFQHASIMHLVLNSIAFISIFHILQRLLKKRYIVVSMVLCGFVASFLSAKAIPTVGASSMVYAMIGTYIGLTSLCSQIKIADTRKYLLFMSCVGLGLLVSLLNPNSNSLVHLYSLILGVVISIPVVLKRASSLVAVK